MDYARKLIESGVGGIGNIADAGKTDRKRENAGWRDINVA